MSFDPTPVLRPADEREADVAVHLEPCAAVLQFHDAAVGFAVVGVGDPSPAPFVLMLDHRVGNGESLYLIVFSPVGAFVAHGIGVFARLAVQRVDGGDKRVALQNDIHDGFRFAALVVNGFPPARGRERFGRERREGAEQHEHEREKCGTWVHGRRFLVG